MMRRFGEPVLSGQSYQPRPGAYAILTRGRRILLTYQRAGHNEFQLPGGGIDPGENPLRALYRETYEETGYAIYGARRLGGYRRFAFMPEYDMWAEKICHIYCAEVGLRKGPPSEADHTAHWVDPDFAVTHLANDGDREFLIDFLRNGLPGRKSVIRP